MFNLIIAFLIGVALGAFYLTVLWHTVHRLPASQNAAALLIGSYVVRMGLVLAGFYLVMDGRWERLVSCMAGFVIARLILLRNLPQSHNDSKPIRPASRPGSSG